MFDPKHIKDATQGFSLIEILITISILSVLFVFSVHSFRDIQNEQKSQRVLAHLANIIQYARSEAIRNGQIVILCKSKDRKSCSGEWSDGQILFKNFKSPKILQNFKALNGGKLDFKGFQSSDFLRFTEKGTTFEQNGRFIYYPTETRSPTHELIVEKSGQTHRLDRDMRGLPFGYGKR
jgi:type IV fimbrial biogenesis protein FimT